MTWREAVLVGSSCGVTLGVGLAVLEEIESWRARNSEARWELSWHRAAECRDGASVPAVTQGQ